MKKIPLEATIASAYRFLFTRILSVIGTVWLPLLVMGVVVAGTAYLVVPHGWWQGQFPAFGDKHPDPAELWAVFKPFAIGLPPVMLVGMVISSMMMVGLLRLALGRTKSSYIFFSLGADVWRLLVAMILLLLLIVLFYFVAVGVAVAGTVLLKPLVPHAAWIIATVVLVIAAICFPIYAVVRMAFFLPAVVVAEHKIGLGRAWHLGGSNFWRIVLVFLVIVIPVGIVAGMVMNIAIMPVLGNQLMRFQDAPTPAEMGAFFRALLPLIPVFLGVSVLQRIAINALMAGAIGSAYNALNPKPEENAAA